MTKDTTKAAAVAADIMLFDNWFNSIEGGVRERVRGFIETMLEEELDGALCRPRYGRHKANGNEKAATLLVGCRHGHRKRALTGHVRKDGDRRATGPPHGRQWQDARMEESIVAGLPTSHEGRRRFDRRRLSKQPPCCSGR